MTFSLPRGRVFVEGISEGIIIDVQESNGIVVVIYLAVRFFMKRG